MIGSKGTITGYQALPMTTLERILYDENTSLKKEVSSLERKIEFWKTISGLCGVIIFLLSVASQF